MILIIGVTHFWVVTSIVRQLIIRNSKLIIRNSKLVILFNVFTEVGQPHITLAQERVVEGQCGAHMLRFVTARSNLQIVYRHKMQPDTKYLIKKPDGLLFESMITTRFWIVTILLAAITVITLKIR